MYAVSESHMAVSMAALGGTRIVHYNCDIATQTFFIRHGTSLCVPIMFVFKLPKHQIGFIDEFGPSSFDFVSQTDKIIYSIYEKAYRLTLIVLVELLFVAWFFWS